MRLINSVIFAVFLATSAATPAQNTPSPSLTNHEAPGNLESTQPLGCNLDNINPSYTPADIYPGVAACIQQGKDDDGVALYIIAGAYGQYDTLRVTDETAHDAPALLRLQAFKPIDVERMKVFQEQILSELQNEKPHSDLCNLLLDLGPPRYYPRYMVQHGMDAFLKPKASDLAPNFDSASHWLVVMKDYLKCDVVVQKP